MPNNTEKVKEVQGNALSISNEKTTPQQGNALSHLDSDPFYKNIAENLKPAETQVTGWGESRYDRSYKAPYETAKDINLTRAKNQGLGDESLYGTAKAAWKLPYGIIGGLGTLADVENFAGIFGVINTDYRNWLTDWANSKKEDIDKTLPIYRKNPEESFDPSDSAFWTNDVYSNVLSSAAEFGLTGFGLGIGAKALSKTLQASKYLKGLGNVMQATNQAHTALQLTYLEGVITGADVYKQVENEYDNNPYFYDVQSDKYVKYDGSQNLDEKIGDKDRFRPIEDSEKEKIASESASEAVRKNFFTVGLNLTSLAPLFKPTNLGRSLVRKELGNLAEEGTEEYVKRLSNLSFKDLNKNKFLKELGAEIPQEALEEGVNVYAQNQGLANAGLMGDEDASFTNSILSKEGLLSMGLGAFGAIAQTGAIKGLSKLSNNSSNQEEQVFDSQKKQILYNLQNGDKIIDGLSSVKNAQSRLSLIQLVNPKTQEENTQKQELETLAKDDLLGKLSYHNLNNGTIDSVYGLVNQALSKTDEELAAEGYESKEQIEEYKNNIQNTLSSLKENENLYNKVQKDYDFMPESYKKEVFLNTTLNNTFKKQKEELTKEATELGLKIENDILMAKGNVVFNTDITEDIASPTSPKFYKQKYTPESQKTIANLNSYKKLEIVDARLKQTNDFIRNIDKRQDEITSDEYVKNYKEQIDTAKTKQEQNEKTVEERKTDVDKAEEKVSNKDRLQTEANNIEKKEAVQKEGDYEEVIPNDQYNDFIKNGNVNEETLQSIASKVKNREELTEREVEIFSSKTSEINKILEDDYKNVTSDLKDIKDIEKINSIPVEIIQNLASNTKEKDVKDDIKETQKGEQVKKDVISQNGIKITPDFKLFSASTIALPSFREYETVDGKIVQKDQFNPEQGNTSVLSLKDYIGQGDKVYAIVEDVREYPVIDFETGNQSIKEIPINDKGENSVIRLVKEKNGEKFHIGYLHNAEYVNEKRVANIDNNLEKQKQNLKKLKEKIFSKYKENNKPVELTITNKNWGKLFTLKSEILLSEAIAKDTNVKFGIVKSDGLYISNSQQFNTNNKILVNNFNNDFLENNTGRVMITLPTVSKLDNVEQHMASYIKPIKLADVKEVGDSIYDVLEAFIKGDIKTLNSFGLNNEPEIISDYLDNFIFRNTNDRTAKEYLFLGFDKNNAPFVSVYDELNPSNGQLLNSKTYEGNSYKLDKWINTQWFNVHINHMNDSNKTINVKTDNGIQKVKYPDLLKSNFKVNFTGNNIVNSNGTTERVYFINPVLEVEFSNQNAASFPYREKMPVSNNPEIAEITSSKPVRTKVSKAVEAIAQQKESIESSGNDIVLATFSLNFDTPSIEFKGLVKDPIKGFIAATKQRDVLKYIVYDFYQNYKVGSAKVKNNFDYIKGTFEETKQLLDYFSNPNNISELTDEDKKYGITDNVDNNKSLAKEYEFIVDNFSEFERLAMQELKNVGFAINTSTIKENEINPLEKEESTDDESNTIDESQGFIRAENYEDGSASLTNPTDKLSAKMKVLLSFIPSSKTNYLGLPQFEEFDTIHTELMKILQPCDASLESMLERMEELKDSKSYLKYVINILNNSSDQIKNEFQSHFNLDYDSRVVIQRNESGVGYNTRIFNSNRNNYNNIIVDNWKNNTAIEVDGIKLYNLDIDKGGVVLNPEFLENVVTPSWAKVRTDKSIESIKSFLSLLGIDISTVTLEKTKEGLNSKDTLVQNIVNKGNWDSQFSEKGLFTGIYNAFINFKNHDVEEETPFTNEQYIKKLAKLESTFTNDVTTSSSRDIEGKSRYDYRLPTRVKVRLKDLLKNKNNIIQSLLNTDIGSYSYILNNLYSEVKGQMFRDNFNIETMEGEVNNETPFKKMYLREQEKLKLDLFCNSGTKVDKNSIATKVLTLSKSDKSTNYVMSFVRPNNLFNTNEAYLSDEALEHLRNIALAEYNRYYKSQDKKLTEKYPQYKPENFYYFQFLNKDISPELYYSNGQIREYNDDIKAIIDDKITQYIKNDIDEQIGLWQKYGFIVDNEIKVDSNYKNSFLQNKDTAVSKLATEYVVTNYIANFDYSIMFSGDVATTFKKNPIKTIDEYFKRLAKDIAPFQIEANAENKTYRIATVKEIVRGSSKEIIENYSKYLKPEDLAKYESDIKVADAQEYVTVEEHLNTLLSYGKIDNDTYTKVLNKVKNNSTLSRKELGMVFQPLKPVQVGQVFEDGFERIMYIKSSAFPLVPQLVKGTKLDKVRKIMENSKIDRLSIESAVKQGLKNPVSWGSFNDDKFIILEDSITTLPRKYMGIQQETPFELDKSKILEGSQLQRLILEGIDDKSIIDKFHNLHTEIMNEAFANFKNEVGYDSEYGGIQDLTKLHEKLVDFAISNNWTENEIQALDITEDKQRFKISPYLSNQPEKIESLITSMVTNDVIKLKFPGFSGILGSELGFFEGIENTNITNDITAIGDWNPKKGLKPMRVEDGKVLPAQILVSKQRFVNLFGTADASKIDPKLLQILGYRIPTQGYNSMSLLEIVGFLPDYMGDLVIPPREFIVQMGSDFDVDKLYIHKLNGDDSLKDEIVKMYMDILSKEELFSRVIKPVDTGELKIVADDIDSMKANSSNRSILNPYQQTLNYFKGTTAKDGVGKTSLLSTLNALFRNKDIILNVFSAEKGYTPTTTNLSDPINENGRNKSDVILEMQSATVDHIKELVADKVNYNNFTHDVFAAMSLIGKDWDNIGYFLPQEAILYYVEEMNLLSDNIDNEIFEDKEKEAFLRVVDKIRSNLGKQKDEYNGDAPNIKDIDLRSLLQNQYKDDKSNDYWLSQLSVIEEFMNYKEIGKELFNVQMGINTSVKGIGKNFIEVNDKISKADALYDIELFGNIPSLLDNTIQGNAIEILKETALIFNKYFPYNTSLVNSIYYDIENMKGSKLNSEKKRYIFKYIRSSAFSKPNNLYGGLDIEQLRNKLLIDSKDYISEEGEIVEGNFKNKSLASRWKNYIKGNPEHFFAKRIYSNISLDPNKPSTIKFLNVGTGNRSDDYQITAELISMLEKGDANEKELANDTILYNFAVGGNQDASNIMKYIPVDYLNKNNFSRNLEPNWNSTESAYKILKQYIQHNPKDAYRLDFNKLIDAAKNKDQTQYLTEMKKLAEKDKSFKLSSNIKSNFVSFYDKKSKGWKLFEKVGDTYKRISTLGASNVVEMNVEQENQTSLFPKNNPSDVNKNIENNNPTVAEYTEDEVKEKIKDCETVKSR